MKDLFKEGVVRIIRLLSIATTYKQVAPPEPFAIRVNGVMIPVVPGEFYGLED